MQKAVINDINADLINAYRIIASKPKELISILEIFQNESVHIIILDYVMPSIDGYNVALEIRKVGCSEFEQVLCGVDLRLIRRVLYKYHRTIFT